MWGKVELRRVACLHEPRKSRSTAARKLNQAPLRMTHIATLMNKVVKATARPSMHTYAGLLASRDMGLCPRRQDVRFLLPPADSQPVEEIAVTAATSPFQTPCHNHAPTRQGKTLLSSSTSRIEKLSLALVCVPMSAHDHLPSSFRAAVPIGAGGDVCVSSVQ